MKHLLFFVLLFTACNGLKKDDSTGKKVANKFGAKDYSMSYNNLVSTDGNKSSIELTLIDVKFKVEHDDARKMTSSIALCLYETISETERKEYNELNVGVKNKGREFNQVYKTADVAAALQQIKTIVLFFAQEEKGSYINVLDPTYIDVDSQLLVRDYIDSILPKKQPRYNVITGFEMSTLDETKEPVIVYTADSKVGDKFLTYTLAVSRETSRIVYLKVR